jgi:arabinofuranosyltransferase
VTTFWKPAHASVYFGLMLLCAVVLLRTAWVADDALITVRSALNFIHGYGPTFNIDERVQAYTHPLWFLLVSGLLLVTHNPFLVVWLLSFVCAVVVCHMVQASFARGPWAGAVGVLALLTSKAYVDFLASGLENPLAHVLIAAYAVVALRIFHAPTFRLTVALAAIGSAIYLTRPDLLLLVAPIGIAVVFRNRADGRRLATALVVGALPAIAWTGFSLWYYGFPFPNTAYAKLGTGLSAWNRFHQAAAYLADSFSRDRLTLPVTAAGILLGLRSAGFDRALAFGIAAYLAYVVWIGGDFMSGRFLTVPLLAAVIVMVRVQFSRFGLAVAALTVLLLALPSARITILSGADYDDKALTDAGIADERGFYFQETGLMSAGWDKLIHGSVDNPRTWTEGQRRVLIVCGRLGGMSLVAGLSSHLIDPCGLSDPLLARLPPRTDMDLRVGHFARILPEGYHLSVSDRANRLEDPDLRDYYEVLRFVTRGPLTSGSRIAEIIRLNLGWSDPAKRVRAKYWRGK